MFEEKTSFFTIFTKLWLALLVVALLPVTALWYLDYQNTQQQLRTEVERELSQALTVVGTQVDNWTDMNRRALEEKAQLDSMVSMNPEQQVPLLQAINRTYDWSYLVFTMGLDGMNVARNDGKALKDYSDRVYVRDILKGRDIAQQVLISRTTGEPAFILSVPIRTNAGNLKGVLAMGTTLADLSKVITDVRIGETGFAFLVDQKGRMIAHGNPDQVTEKLQNMKDHPVVRNIFYHNKQINFTNEGTESIGMSRKVGLDWTLVVQQDTEEAFAPLHQAQQTALVVLLATLVFVTLIAYFAARMLAKPIRELTSIADNYSQGELDSQIPHTQRRDEIGALARAVQRMGTSLKMAFAELDQQH